MNATDFEAVVYDGEVYCVGCCPVPISNEEVHPIFAASEWDYPPACCKCLEIHEYMHILEAEDESI
jgi:hypothetical protein